MDNFFDIETIEKAIKGNRVFSKNNKKEDFNKAFKHIFSLLKDAKSLYISKSFSTALFLAITAIEETAKAEIGLYQYNNENDDLVKRSKDPLYNHKKKHVIALIQTVIMSRRIEDSLGIDRCKELLKMAHNGDLIDIREKGLYFFTKDDIFYTPSMFFDKKLSKEILLLAIECFDDRLVGYTNFTIRMKDSLNDLFKSISIN